MAGDVGGRSCTDSELLLHPELLSQEFLLLTLEQKNITVENDIKINKDNLTDLYVQHAIPLPQRDLPKNRWGKMMEKKREQHEIKHEIKRSTTVDGLRKRPLIVFDGSSTSTSIKVKKTENGDNDRLKPPPQNHDLTLRKSSSDPVKLPLIAPVGTTPVKLKRVAPKEEAEPMDNLKPPEAKRKIQHVTWP
ncbi:PREDICTED: ashwin-like isoform X2 [Elephantulus edwardii]|uniref:ashwin-like isoform X2 n=1 Tax=Elephantulus edwardii TaxID=28737 RepID=UPI0003F0AF64|nr:PREDICTED: ashwin-like isoform X2 [Elephantulus edwardii]